MKRLAPLYIILAGCLWGSMGVFVRKFNEINLKSMNIVGVRAIFTAIFMIIMLYIYDKKLFKINIKDLWCFFGTGFCSIIFFNYCYFKTITMTSLSAAAILLYTAPSIVMIISAVLFKESVTKRKIVSLIIAFAGCIFVSGIGGERINISLGGFLTGIGAGVGYALYSIFGRIALEKKYDPLTITAYTFIFAGIGSLPLMDVKSTFQYCVNSLGNFGYCGVFAVISTILPFIFYTVGLKYVESSKASIMASIEPVVATIIGMIVFNEKFTIMSGIGVTCVVISIILINSDKFIKAENHIEERK